MIAYIIKRLLSAIPVLLGISVIVFIIMALIPGDPATAILGSFATPENVEKLNRDLGLDKPMIQRYFIWLGNMLQGDFGRSFSLNKDVLDEISVSWSIDDDENGFIRLKFPESDIDGDASFSLSLEFIKHPSILE